MPAVLSGLSGLWLTWHYPTSPWAISAVFIAACALCFTCPCVWLVVVPALLPLIGFAPWTGWITFEEFDLLLLAVAVGGYGWLAFNRPVPMSRPRGAGGLAKLTVALFAISVLVSMARGVADAGGFEFGWYQGYHEPMNSLRLAKPLFLALLLFPLWRMPGTDPLRTRDAQLSFGLTLGLAGVAAAAVWERLAYPGLLDFSTNYRTTALFWEMHVGGAAIDGFLALALPFAVHEMVIQRSRWRWSVAAVATVLGGYACLSTFSRGLYLAVPVSLGVLLWLQHAQRSRLVRAKTDRPASRVRPGLLLVAGFAAAAAWMFPTSGYRGLLALLGAFAVLLVLAEAARAFTRGHWLLGIGTGSMLSALAVACAWIMPKGAYVAYALALIFSAAMLGVCRLGQHRRSGTPGAAAAAPLALAGFVATLVGMVLVGLRWGGNDGLTHAMPVSAILMAVLVAVSRSDSPMWPPSLRWQGTALGAMVMVAGTVGVFAGGNYMSERFAGEGQVLGGRTHNWRLGLAMLNSPLDWAFGKGLGRFPANYALAATGTDWRPGDYRIASDAGGPRLVISAGTHPLGWLALLRVSQRMSTPQPPVSVRVDVRAEKPVGLLFEVCEKHLLYSEACLSKATRVDPKPGQWQTLQLLLEGKPPSRGNWYAPKLIVFSVGMDSEGARVELDNLHLAGADGANLLANSDFSEGLAHWFFTSDGYHTPWHIEGIFMNALFEQGMIGAVVLLALVGGALWRTILGNARDNALAPAVATALLGFTMVGLFSSVTDVPRVAFLFYFLLLLGLSLRGPPMPAR